MTSFTLAWTVAIFWTKMKICFCVAVFVEWKCFMDYEREKKLAIIFVWKKSALAHKKQTVKLKAYCKPPITCDLRPRFKKVRLCVHTYYNVDCSVLAHTVCLNCWGFHHRLSHVNVILLIVWYWQLFVFCFCCCFFCVYPKVTVWLMRNKNPRTDVFLFLVVVWNLLLCII